MSAKLTWNGDRAEVGAGGGILVASVERLSENIWEWGVFGDGCEGGTAETREGAVRAAEKAAGKMLLLTLAAMHSEIAEIKAVLT